MTVEEAVRLIYAEQDATHEETYDSEPIVYPAGSKYSPYRRKLEEVDYSVTAGLRVRSTFNYTVSATGLPDHCSSIDTVIEEI